MSTTNCYLAGTLNLTNVTPVIEALFGWLEIDYNVLY